MEIQSTPDETMKPNRCVPYIRVFVQGEGVIYVGTLTAHSIRTWAGYSGTRRIARIDRKERAHDFDLTKMRKIAIPDDSEPRYQNPPMPHEPGYRQERF